MKIPNSRRGLVRGIGVAAVTIWALAAMAGQRAEALTLVNPGTVPAVKYASEGLTTEVRGGHGGHGGHGFHGGFRGGGARFHGGGMRAGHVFRGGGIRYGGYHVARHHRRHFVFRRHYAPVYYAAYHHRRYCRVIWTYYGPRKICRYRPWFQHYRRHHRFHRYW